MSNWRDQILSEFTPQVAQLTIVADPDGLLLEEGVLKGIRERGFELIPFDDHVAFRYAYELNFRSRWDCGEETDLVVVLRSPLSNLDALPYDLIQTGRKLSFSLGDLFPNLSYPIVAALDRSDLDALFDAQTKYVSEQLGDNATKDFVLRHVFEIVPELIKQPSDLLRVLLRRHYSGQRIPAILDERFIEVLRQNNLFEDWPLETIVPDREAFFAFLQERWPVFLESLEKRKDGAIQEEVIDYGFEFPGPALLPFDHHDVRIYIDNFFIEGLLKPVPHKHAEALTKTWVAKGIKLSPLANRLRRIEGLHESIKKTLPPVEARHSEWFNFAHRWAELVSLELEENTNLPAEHRERLEALRSLVDSNFTAWVLEHYISLFNLPPEPPVMLHHIPRYFARTLVEESHKKSAFLLVDGLALDQWITLREVLRELDPKLKFREGAVFAWIPTITSVSRQAAFAGKPPLYFPMSIHNTDKEKGLWTQFWLDQGMTKHEVDYAKGQSCSELNQISELISQPSLRIIGLVIDKVDRIMHGMELGAAGMHNQIRQWARQGFLQDLFVLLHDHGFQVFLASDHGNIEAKGVGVVSEGVVADVRGERVRVYPNPKLRAQIRERFPEAIEWPPVGLPEDYFVLLAPKRAAFVRENKVIVSHGGISIEELIVPFVRIDRRV